MRPVHYRRRTKQKTYHDKKEHIIKLGLLCVCGAPQRGTANTDEPDEVTCRKCIAMMADVVEKALASETNSVIDKLAETWAVTRLPGETDQELRYRIQRKITG